MPRIPYKGQEIDALEVDFQTRKEDWNEYCNKPKSEEQSIKREISLKKHSLKKAKKLATQEKIKRELTKLNERLLEIYLEQSFTKYGLY